VLLISKWTVDRVYETARIEEVIGDFVQLKKSGANYKGLSPFTDERSPSFMVSPVKQIWKDFSSGKGGNVVAFLMEHEHFTYPEAIKYLAKKYAIDIEETEQTEQQKQETDLKESLFLVSEYAQSYFEDILWNHPSGQSIGLSYFRERGFTDETIKLFGLGYCLDQWDGFTQEALKKQHKIEYLEATGLSIVKNQDDGSQKYFDRFKARVLFPIHSMSGRVLGFGGRILISDPKAAKYLNSPESDIYHKSKVLYGIYHAKQAISKLDECYLVEGYTDVIQFHQSGIKNTVASSGTALTADQIRLIARLTNNITVLFDGDAAGLRASLRGIDLILAQGMNVRVCAFPDGEDPDSFAKSHTTYELEQYLKSASKDFIQFKATLLVSETQGDPIKRAETIRDMVQSISLIPDPIKQEVYIQSCAQIMEVSESVLFDTLAQIDKKMGKSTPVRYSAPRKSFEVVKPNPERERKDQLELLEQKIIELLLLYGTQEVDFDEWIQSAQPDGTWSMERKKITAKVFEKIFLDLQMDEVELSHPGFKSLYSTLIQGYHSDPNFDAQRMVHQMDDSSAQLVAYLLMEDEKYQLDAWDRKEIYPKEKRASLAQLVTETVLTLRCFLIDKIMENIQQTTLSPDTDQEEALEEVMNYRQLYNLLNQHLGRVVIAR
jgi:DNA primase